MTGEGTVQIVISKTVKFAILKPVRRKAKMEEILNLHLGCELVKLAISWVQLAKSNCAKEKLILYPVWNLDSKIFYFLEGNY